MTATLADLAVRARSLVRGKQRVILGITGSPGSGKSTVVYHLLRVLRPAPPDGAPANDWVAHVPMDGFHLADVELDRLGRRDRKGAPDTFDAGGYVALLRRLLEDTQHVVYAPTFERTLEQPVAGSIPVNPAAQLVITEGNYLLLDEEPWIQVRSLAAEVWYCDAAEDRRLNQLISRHALFGKAPDAASAWARGADERNATLVRSTRGRADFVIADATLKALHQPV